MSGLRPGGILRGGWIQHGPCQRGIEPRSCKRQYHDDAKPLRGAFSRGDVATVLAGCTANVEWHAGGRREDFPTFGPRKGIQQVQEFFQTVAQLERFTEFSPREFYADGHHVFALGTLSITLISNGRQLSSEWAHVITFRDDKVARFREFLDTAAYVAAYRA